MKRQARAQIHLPPLEAHEALRLVQCLESAVAAIWKAHGQQMSELLLDRHCDAHPETTCEEQPDLPF